MSLQALVARSRAIGGAAEGQQRIAEEERLFEVACQVEVLSSLPLRRAPAALDVVLELLEGVESDPAAGGEESEPEALPQSPEVIAAFECEDGRLSEWMRSLPAAVAPTELDARFETELAQHLRALPATDFPASESTVPVASALRSVSGLPKTGGEIGARSGLRLSWNRRWVAMAAAALLLGAIGVAVLYRGLRLGGSGAVEDPGTSSRFSFHYVDVETAGADVAQRPALRLLRGWASHIAPEELERSSSGK